MEQNGYLELAARLRRGEPVVRKTMLDGARLGQAVLLDAAPDAQYPREERTADGAVLTERFDRGKALLICGGGHVSRPVSMLGKLLGYRVIVMDDRPEFANRERFPDADEVVCGDFASMLSGYGWDVRPDTSVVIVTRGHVADTVCLRQVVGRNLPYIGMIGSKKKNAAVFEALRGEGVAQERLARVHAPVGLPIGGRTPEEIAVSIAAELIAERRGLETCALSDAMLDALADKTGAGGIMAVIVRKSGSAPRGVGARLLVLPDGSVLGTVGGGLAEHQVIEQARALLNDPHPLLRHFDMADGEAGKSGLICGGAVDVLFEVVG